MYLEKFIFNKRWLSFYIEWVLQRYFKTITFNILPIGQSDWNQVLFAWKKNWKRAHLTRSGWDFIPYWLSYNCLVEKAFSFNWEPKNMNVKVKLCVNEIEAKISNSCYDDIEERGNNWQMSICFPFVDFNLGGNGCKTLPPTFYRQMHINACWVFFLCQ